MKCYGTVTPNQKGIKEQIAILEKSEFEMG
jgi:hypothetical protein